MEKTPYNWTFTSVGGAVRVKITSGADIAHLGELDRKLWTVLSCPARNLEFDQKTLELIDADHDGNIRVDEVIATAEWLTGVLKDPDLLLTRGTESPSPPSTRRIRKGRNSSPPRSRSSPTSSWKKNPSPLKIRPT